jgi:signal transduction histidine kinase
VAARPELVHRHLNLPDDAGGKALARSAAFAACHDWDLPHVAEDLAEIAGELVLNAIKHARSAPSMTLTLTGSDVTVSVRDDLRHPAPRPGSAPSTPRGAGGC